MIVECELTFIFLEEVCLQLFVLDDSWTMKIGHEDEVLWNKGLLREMTDDGSICFSIDEEVF